MKINKLTTLFLAIILSGCATDMLRERGALTDELHTIAKNMTRIAGERCIKVSGNTEIPRDNWQKGRKLDGEWAVLRFYVGSGDWYKATTSSQGVMDNLYYNPKTNRLVCGDHGWYGFSNSKEINFKEYGSIEKRL